MRFALFGSHRRQRGAALIIALFVVVLLLLVGIAVLINASYSASTTLAIDTKNQTFDAAEAGLNAAQYNIDQNLSTASGTGSTGSVFGYTYNWKIVDNEIGTGASKTVSDPDPKQSGTITVPAGSALLAGWASSILGGRTVYAEAMMRQTPPTYLPNGAITCGKTAQISHQQITDSSGHHHADIRCGSFTASGGGQTPDGNSYATCNTSGCNAITGYDGVAHTDQAPPLFLTAAQLAAIQSATLSQAKSGGSNYYTAGNYTSGDIGASGSNCVAYIGGNLTLSGKTVVHNYCATTVVMGDVTISGSADYQALPTGTSHIMYVFGTGGTTLQGTTTAAGTFYVANADVTLNGSGKGNFTGGIITPNNVTMNGGGSASFFYNSTSTPPPVVNNNVVPESQWEY